MTAQQEQWIRVIEDRLWKIEDSGVTPNAIAKVQEILEGVENLRSILNGINGRSEVESSRQIGAGR